MLRLKKYSYRFAEQILNSKFSLKEELEGILTDPSIDPSKLTKQYFNQLLDDKFVNRGWDRQPYIFNNENDSEESSDSGNNLYTKMDFYKDRVGVEVAFTHSSYMGIDLLKFQVASYSNVNKIDVGVYIVATKNFQKQLVNKEKGMNWGGATITFEKVEKYLPHYRSAIHVPIYVLGIDI
ncbi:BglII/BstYI family type II restriction endonuclease [Methanocella sp. MCL-LM]|uniref:BglII/BstYI family type II restriction endonuclease n=1 Tax=Methanocella sp. MCL-LM TaxID=3412035 RepID=UPI003C784DAB